MEKRNAAEEKTIDAEVEDVATPAIDTTDVRENGETEVAQFKQKKKPSKKVRIAVREKTEIKGKQEKGQIVAVPVVEEEVVNDATMENDTVQKIDSESEMLNKNDSNDITPINISTEEEENETDKNELAEPEKNGDPFNTNVDSEKKIIEIKEEVD